MTVLELDWRLTRTFMCFLWFCTLLINFSHYQRRINIIYLSANIFYFNHIFNIQYLSELSKLIEIAALQKGKCFVTSSQVTCFLQLICIIMRVSGGSLPVSILLNYCSTINIAYYLQWKSFTFSHITLQLHKFFGKWILWKLVLAGNRKSFFESLSKDLKQ